VHLFAFDAASTSPFIYNALASGRIAVVKRIQETIKQPTTMSGSIVCWLIAIMAGFSITMSALPYQKAAMLLTGNVFPDLSIIEKVGAATMVATIASIAFVAVALVFASALWATGVMSVDVKW
jgi:hypothetical protein